MYIPMNKLRFYYWKIYFSSYYISILFSFLSKNKPKIFNTKQIDTLTKVYAVHGSAIIFSKFFFKKGGYIDDNFELFLRRIEQC